MEGEFDLKFCNGVSCVFSNHVFETQDVSK